MQTFGMLMLPKHDLSQAQRRSCEIDRQVETNNQFHAYSEGAFQKSSFVILTISAFAVWNLIMQGMLLKLVELCARSLKNSSGTGRLTHRHTILFSVQVKLTGNQQLRSEVYVLQRPGLSTSRI